jgi:hypothetical protein
LSNSGYFISVFIYLKFWFRSYGNAF